MPAILVGMASACGEAVAVGGERRPVGKGGKAAERFENGVFARCGAGAPHDIAQAEQRGGAQGGVLIQTDRGFALGGVDGAERVVGETFDVAAADGLGGIAGGGRPRLNSTVKRRVFDGDAFARIVMPFCRRDVVVSNCAAEDEEGAAFGHDVVFVELDLIKHGISIQNFSGRRVIPREPMVRRSESERCEELLGENTAEAFSAPPGHEIADASPKDISE